MPRSRKQARNGQSQGGGCGEGACSCTVCRESPTGPCRQRVHAVPPGLCRAVPCVHALVLVGWQITTESANGRTSKASRSSLLNKSPEGRLELAGHRTSMSERCPLLPHRPLLEMQVPLAAEPRLAAAPVFCSLLHSFCCYCNQYLSLSASPLTRSDFSFCEGF